ncbi:MAG: aminopeptidase P family protein [Anaerolineales bacterium]|nr:aminopeptidase P family protein [Anaerolineales bacterium]
MKSDLDRLMQERDIDAFVIIGSENENTDRNYLTNSAHASATVVKKRGQEAVLIVSAMEIDEAKKSGLTVYTMQDFDLFTIMQKHAGKQEEVFKEYWTNIFDKFEISGRVAFYGTASVMGTWRTLNRFQRLFGERIELVEDEDPNIFSVARRTKDAHEIEQLREAGKRSGAAMREVREWLSQHRAEGEFVFNSDGEPLTIGDVKRYLWHKLMDYGMEDVGGTVIFSQGYDAALPHSRGEAEQQLRLGQTIIFDLFPRIMGGGYFHDMTRTWCIGYAPKEVEEAYHVVMHAFAQSLEAMTLGEPIRDIQNMVNSIFEEHGHPTHNSHPGTNEGYTHSIGHGLGLDVHESPGMSGYASNESVFEAGDVVTIEPGLYYPSKEWGIRIEDTVYMSATGEVINLTDCPYDLIVTLNG